MILSQNVKIQNWAWEISYSGASHGEGRITNNLDYAIEGVTYTLNYYDYHGNFIAEDNGSIPNKLYPGEKYNFTFWSTNAKNPSTANLKLVFPDRLLYKIIKEQTYIGDEYNQYIREIKKGNSCSKEYKDASLKFNVSIRRNSK